jgi:hypothetical protein
VPVVALQVLVDRHATFLEHVKQLRTIQHDRTFDEVLVVGVDTSTNSSVWK